jgi:cytochrome c-type biogenesis protein CcmH
VSTDTPSRRPVYWCIAAALAAVAFAVALLASFGESGAVRGNAAPDVEGVRAVASTGTATREQLVAHLANSPRDGRSWVLLARLDFAGDRFAAAAQEYAKALEVSTKVARDPDVWCEYADALGMTQGGSLQGQPREFVERALAIDPNHAKALEMAGSAAYEQRDYAAATEYWRKLLAQLPADSTQRRELVAALSHVELQASQGIDPPRAADEKRSNAK